VVQPTFNTVQLQRVIDSIADYGTLELSGGTYSIDAQLSITRPLNIVLASDAVLQMTVANTTLFRVSTGSFHISGYGRLLGPQYVAQQTNERALWIEGASASAMLDNVTVAQLRLEQWGMYGVYGRFLTNFVIDTLSIKNIYYTGIGIASGIHGRIKTNYIDNVVGTPNAYGIFTSRTETDSLVTDPRSDDITIGGNVVRNVPNWDGINTHGGSRHTITGNNVYNCQRGIEIVASDGAANGSQLFAFLDVDVVGNTVDSGVDDGSKTYGIVFAGGDGGLGTPTQLGTGTIAGNTVRGYGAEGNDLSGAMYVRDTLGVSISGNTLHRSANAGLLLYHDNYNFNVVGNTFIDTWTSLGTAASAIWVRSNFSTGFVGGNLLGVDAVSPKVATHVNDYGLRVSNSSTNLVKIGENYFHTAATGPIESAGRLRVRGRSLASADKGDVDFTWTPGVDQEIIRYATTLTANRTITIASMTYGDELFVYRTAAGAFNLSVGGLKTLTQNQWVRIVHDGAGQRVIAFGSL
jgi:parallel beta-helix repeat protein